MSEVKKDSIEIIRVGKAELPATWNFFAKTLGEYFPQYSDRATDFLIEDYDRKYLGKKIKDRGKKIWAAVIKKRVVGYLITTKQYGGVTFANWLAVDKVFRGKGVASLLIQTWEKQALEDGAHKLYLWATENNLHFYAKNGFVVVGKFPDGYFGSDDFVLYKSLRKSIEENYLKGGTNEERD